MSRAEGADAASPVVSERAALAVQMVGWLICFCLLLNDFGPGPPWIAVLIQLLPWAFALWLSITRNFAMMDGLMKPSMPVVIAIPMISGFALLEAPAFFMLEWRPVLLAAGALALVYALILGPAWLRFEREKSEDGGPGPGGSLFVILVLGVAMGFALNVGLVTNLNGLSQRHAPEIVAGVVEKRFTSSGRGPLPYLHISGPAERIEDQLGLAAFQTDYDRWGRVKEGMKACVAIHTGLLGWRWYDVVDC